MDCNNFDDLLSSGDRFTKHSYIYELKYLVNHYETMLANIGETLIYEIICSIRARTLLVKRAPVSLSALKFTSSNPS